MAAETKVCPYCAEEIQAAANKCRHCGEFLNQAAAAPTSPEANGGKGGAGLALGITALVFGVLAFVIAWIPLLGLLGLPLSGLGVIFAMVGLIIGITSKRGSAIGFSVAGGGISAVALVLALGSTVALSAAMVDVDEAMDRGRQRRTMADMRDMATARIQELASLSPCGLAEEYLIWRSDFDAKYAPQEDGTSIQITASVAEDFIAQSEIFEQATRLVRRSSDRVVLKELQDMTAVDSRRNTADVAPFDRFLEAATTECPDAVSRLRSRILDGQVRDR